MRGSELWIINWSGFMRSTGTCYSLGKYQTILFFQLFISAKIFNTVEFDLIELISFQYETTIFNERVSIQTIYRSIYLWINKMLSCENKVIVQPVRLIWDKRRLNLSEKFKKKNLKSQFLLHLAFGILSEMD